MGLPSVLLFGRNRSRDEAIEEIGPDLGVSSRA
jgi:hypothetical protein